MEKTKGKDRQRKKFDPERFYNWLNETRLIEHPQVAQRANIAMQTGNWRHLVDFLKLNPRLKQQAIATQAQEQWLAQNDPFHPRPLDHEFMGDIFFAYILDPISLNPISTFRVKRDDLPRNIILFGRPGAGKTNAMLAMIKSIRETLGDLVRFLVFDQKRRYRDFLYPEFMPLDLTDFIDQIFEPPTPRIPLNKWFDYAIGLMSTEMYFQTASVIELADILTFLANRLHRAPHHSEILAEIELRKDKPKLVKAREPLNTLYSRFKGIVRLDNNSKTVSIPQGNLLDNDILIELGEELPEALLLRTAVMIGKTRMYKKYESPYTKLPLTIIVTDDSEDIYGPRSSEFGKSILLKDFTLAREDEIGFIIGTHEPASIATTVKSNAYIIIAYPFSDGKQLAAIRDSMLLTKEQFKYYLGLSELGEGHAMVRYGSLARPFPVYFPDMGKPEKRLTDSDIADKKSQFLQKYSVIDQVPSFNTQRPDTPKPPCIIPDDSVTILETLKLEPFLNVTQLIDACAFSIDQCSDACGWLVRNDYLMPHKIRAGRKGALSKFHELSDSAYSFLEIPKPSWGNEGFRHRYYKHIMARHFGGMDWIIELEAKSQVSGHKFDILATRPDEAIDIEITLNSKNLHDNIVNGFADTRITQILVVCEKDDLLRFRYKVAQDVLDNGYRLEFKPITDFFPN